jgi:hypothetical protein
MVSIRHPPTTIYSIHHKKKPMENVILLQRGVSGHGKTASGDA